MKNQIFTQQVPRIVWKAYFVDGTGHPTSDRVAYAETEAEAKQKLCQIEIAENKQGEV
jgi:hypothetical protein